MGEVALGTLYELNKSAMEKEKKMINTNINKTLKEMEDFFSKGSYFMLLCHEQRDYTVFYLTTENKIKNATEDLKLCLQNRGEILSMDPTEDGIAYEIWIRNIKGVFAYYLFPYDEAVLIC